MHRFRTMSFKSIFLKIKSFSLSKISSLKSSSDNMSRDLDVLVFGSSNIDYITYVNQLPKPGETMYGMHREQCFGGKGANQCVAATKLGGNCALISKLGDDELGGYYFDYLQGLGINVEFLERVEDTPTGIAEITVDDEAENTIIVLSGANAFLKSKDASRSKKLFKRAKVLLCQLETEDKAVLCAIQQFKGVSVLNASPARKDLPVELIKAPTILCINEVEAAQLTDREKVVTLQDAKAAANDLLAKGVKSVIITMGDQGAVHLSSKEPDACTHCPAAPVRYLADTSGAGDAFLGSLAFHMARFPNLKRESHITAANICAAYAVGHRGTQPSFPGPELAQENLCMYMPTYSVISDEAPEEKQAEAAPATQENTEAAIVEPAEVEEKEPEKVELKEPEKVEEKEPEKIEAKEPEKAEANEQETVEGKEAETAEEKPPVVSNNKPEPVATTT